MFKKSFISSEETFSTYSSVIIFSHESAFWSSFSYEQNLFLEKCHFLAWISILRQNYFYWEVTSRCQNYFLKNQITKPPGVNFTNALRAAFTRADPKSTKKLLNLMVFFALLGTARVKAAHRMFVKLTPGVTSLWVK